MLNVLVQVRDIIGGVQCGETTVLIRVLPEEILSDLLSVTPQV